MKVLVIDDSRAIRDLVVAYVEEVGHTAIGASDGNDALEIFSHESFDLIIMDVEMPGIDGFETTRRIRARLSDKWIPIVFLSSNYSGGHFVEGINAGGDAYLGKPVNGPVLQAMVRAMGRIASTQEQLAEANRELERLSQIDPLTNLLNRRGFFQHFDREWGRANRENSPVAVILLDVDQFKPYNDNYGHLKGDACLKKIAAAIGAAILRPADVVARYGGEEFIVLLPNTEIDGAKEVAERIRVAVHDQKLEHKFSAVSDHVTVSLGVACKKTSHENTDELIALADSMLYKAKETGRNKYIADDD